MKSAYKHSLVVICLLLLAVFPFSTVSLAADGSGEETPMSTTATENNIISTEEISLLNDYLEMYFKNQMCINEKLVMSKTSIEIMASETKVTEENKKRIEEFQALEDRVGAEFVDVQSEVSINSVTKKEDSLILDVSEKRIITYQYPGKTTTNTCWYITDHIIELELTNSKYKIVSDSYYEAFTGIDTRPQADEVLENMEIEQIAEADFGLNQLSAEEIGTTPEAAEITANYSGYSPTLAIAYSNQYANSINSKYGEATTSAGESADCANFVSQCLHEGGIALISGTVSTGWYYTQNQTYSTPWAQARAFDAFWSTRVEKVTGSTRLNLLPGNPLYWVNSEGWPTGHLMFGVGYDETNTPVYNGHNPYAYQIPYTFVSNQTLNTLFFVEKCDSHNYVYEYDDDSHWNKCITCRFKTAPISHSLSSGSCICGYAP